MEPTATFNVRASNQPPRAGISLRGQCTNAEAALRLEQAIADLLAAGAQFIWADCQHLTSLNWHGQRAMLNAHQRARVAGCSIYWCGFSPAVRSQLADTGLHLLLSMLPAASYQGPAALVMSNE